MNRDPRTTTTTTTPAETQWLGSHFVWNFIRNANCSRFECLIHPPHFHNGFVQDLETCYLVKIKTPENANNYEKIYGSHWCPMSCGMSGAKRNKAEDEINSETQSVLFTWLGLGCVDDDDQKVIGYQLICMCEKSNIERQTEREREWWRNGECDCLLWRMFLRAQWCGCFWRSPDRYCQHIVRCFGGEYKPSTTICDIDNKGRCAVWSGSRNTFFQRFIGEPIYRNGKTRKKPNP